MIFSDIDKKRINSIRWGLPPFYEPILEEMLRHALDENIPIKAVEASKQKDINIMERAR